MVVAMICLAIACDDSASPETETKNASKASANETGEQPAPLLATGESQNPATRFAVSIRKPLGPPQVSTGLQDMHGNLVLAACSTCHTTRPPNHQNKLAKDLDEFHSEMQFSHGTISCLSCHNERDYDALKLADGSRVEYADVMLLCAQCHGPQMTAYQHGAHGGMTGYWDLARGPQTKNNCIDCHDPHAPKFPSMQPTFKPQDRFLDPPRTDH